MLYHNRDLHAVYCVLCAGEVGQDVLCESRHLHPWFRASGLQA